MVRSKVFAPDPCSGLQVLSGAACQPTLSPPLLFQRPTQRWGRGPKFPGVPSSCRPLGTVCCHFATESPVQRALLRSVRSQGAAPASPSGPTIQRSQSSGLTGPLPRLGPVDPGGRPLQQEEPRLTHAASLIQGHCTHQHGGPEMGQDDFSPAQPQTVHPQVLESTLVHSWGSVLSA